MKYLLFISILLLTVSCSQPNNGFEVDSAEAIAGLKTDLKLTELDIAKEIHYWLGLDSSSVAYFKTDSSTIFRVIKKLQMRPDTIGKYLMIPESSPGWFGPSIDREDRLNKTWIKAHSDRKIFLQINEEQNECFFASIKWN